MAVLFALSLVLYWKNKRMELAVMGFALAAALAISGVTATLRDRAKTRREAAAAVYAAQSAQSAEVIAASTNATWFSQPDGTYLHADGTSADAAQTDLSASSGTNPAQPELPQAAPMPGASDEAPEETGQGPTPA